ncbi:MAG: DUF5060 domain-containing protein, partial [Chloroflexi bacterium]|nr:DUF5060 domain-containing protein [Chloroflexota bacterium]
MNGVLSMALVNCNQVEITPVGEQTAVSPVTTVSEPPPSSTPITVDEDITAVPEPTPSSTPTAAAATPTETVSMAVISGTLQKWSPLTLSFTGPQADELDNAPNPFLDYRLQVTFTGPSGQQYVAPGFFDGDGAGNGAGNIWKAHFTPDEAGQWQYTASFRRGTNLAIDLNPDAGVAAGFDGTAGFIEVAASDPDAPNFLQWGRLEYVGEHYLKFRDGPYWIKGGADSPENFLAYSGFDNTIGSHQYDAHLIHWQEGDPDWGNGKGKALIGSLNYLASQHINSIYLLLMNIGGDGKDVWPFAGSINPKGRPKNDNLHYDISKLGQWEIVFDHAQKKGIFLHFVFGETEEANRQELGDSELSVERMLFYREMIARFGHYNALQWNISEEFNQSSKVPPPIWSKEDVDRFAAYIKAIDPYDHPITAHGDWAELWGDPFFEATSYQHYPEYQTGALPYGDKVEADRLASQRARRPIPIFVDETNRTLVGDDESHNGENLPFTSGASFQRKDVLWPIYFSGGGGVEYILEDILNTEDFSRYESMWQYTWHARKFMEENLPFWEMDPADDLLLDEATYFLEDGQVFAKIGQVYAVYLPAAESGGRLDLSGINGRFQQRWYNPRTGQFEGELQILEAGDW